MEHAVRPGLLGRRARGWQLDLPAPRLQVGGPIRLADPAGRHHRHAAEIEARVVEVLRSGRYVGGPVVAEAEAAIAAHFGLAHAVGVGSGTEALWLSLMALDLPAQSRIAVPALSFFATAEAVLLAGHQPVFVDVLPDRPLMDPTQVPSDVAAVVLVHLFGMRCPTPAVDVPIVSDAAQCAGWGHGAPQGVLSSLSLYPSKTLGVAGDGGVVLTDDDWLAEKVRRIGTHGAARRDLHVELGTTSRLDAVQAAVALALLPHVPAWVERRRSIADAYDAVVQGLPRDPADPVHQYVFLTDDRDALRQRLDAAGIDNGVYYSHPMDIQPTLTDQPIGAVASRCPNAGRYCERALSVPVHEGLTDDDVARVLEVLA
ncbi:MAG: erythromycin biosynthesis sensory transduction protein eryC1 [Proteobacteria bacterium]|nr:erythromycin biosynthesis sensory transduction protein eryC1 [Pseudomonadota bacterium]MCP4917318.1 erythromycin biosynthesis sensory transduction protein eryC1 [Pseudomonadota bacterium]